MIKEYKIGSDLIKFDLEKQITRLENNENSLSMYNGLSDRTIRNKVKTHIHSVIYNSLNVNPIIKFSYKNEIDEAVEDVINNIHISLILKHKNNEI